MTQQPISIKNETPHPLSFDTTTIVVNGEEVLEIVIQDTRGLAYLPPERTEAELADAREIAASQDSMALRMRNEQGERRKAAELAKAQRAEAQLAEPPAAERGFHVPEAGWSRGGFPDRGG